MTERYIVLDLWQALGLDSQDCGLYCDLNGVPDTWSNLLDCCRHLVGKRICGVLVSIDDWCVLKTNHNGPHYGSDDVGNANDLLPLVISKMQIRKHYE